MTESEFERLHTETAAPLHAYLSRVGGSAALADDLVQAAYLRFLAARRIPEDDRGRRAYLFRIGRNLLRDEVRRRAVARKGTERLAVEAAAGADDSVAGVPGGPSAGIACESRIEVRRALDALRKRDRELLWLAYVVGMSHREIAEVTGVQVASVRLLLHRARTRFSELLEQRGVGSDDLR